MLCLLFLCSIFTTCVSICDESITGITTCNQQDVVASATYIRVKEQYDECKQISIYNCTWGSVQEYNLAHIQLVLIAKLLGCLVIVLSLMLAYTWNQSILAAINHNKKVT